MSENIKKIILKNALKSVVFDGWSDELFETAVEESKVNYLKAKELFPRKSIDIAMFHHFQDDEKLFEINNDELVDLRTRDKISKLIFTRILIANQNKEALRRSMALFSLPFLLLEGKKMIYNTSDVIWRIVEQEKKSPNKLSKRISLMYLYSTSLLFSIGDESSDLHETKSFIERSVNNFMKFEKIKKNISDFSRKSNFSFLKKI